MSDQGGSYAELEIGISRVAGVCQVELRYTDPESEAEILPLRGETSLDPDQLLPYQLDSKKYGKALGEALFPETRIPLPGGKRTSLRAHYRQIETAVQQGGLDLRLRLRLDPSASDLQALRWEMLRDPESGAALATSERILFSRFMASQEWRRVKLRAETELSALIAVAAPSDLGEGDWSALAAIDLDAEVARARGALEGARVEVAGRPLTLDHLTSRLRDGNDRRGVDVLYLACHGALSKRRKEPVLYLQQDDGTTAAIHGDRLAERLRELRNPPRLVFLASCDSALTPQAPQDADADEAGTDDRGEVTAQASLAPRLAEAGVAAIVAMQGKISMPTVAQTVPKFFTELMVDGRIDRALAVARGCVRDRHDAWMPALYTRLKSCRLWYEPGFTEVEDEFERWQSITDSVSQGTFVPILGPDFGEHICGSSGERACRLAERHGFPLSPHQRSDLAKVAQFLSIDESRRTARNAVIKGLRREVLARRPDADGDGEFGLPALLDAAVERCRAGDDDPFRILSELKAPIYINASPDPLLLKSLRAAGLEPTLVTCGWRSDPVVPPPDDPPPDDPSPDQPLLYHPLGMFGQWDSLVLTEDDYFDYLIAASTYKLMPAAVRSAVVESSLIFFGFPLDDWTFRVLFRQIMTLKGVAKLHEFAHVGVQVDPEGHSLADVKKARKYLQDYFAGIGSEAPRIDIYWGSPVDFLKELRERLARIEETAPRIEEGEDVWIG